MDFFNELFGSEMGELKRHQKVKFISCSRSAAYSYCYLCCL